MVALQHGDRYPGATTRTESVPRVRQLPPYGRAMSNTRYGHTNRSGGNQDQGERKDAGWESRQGGRQSTDQGRRGEPSAPEQPGEERETLPPPGTNTQGGLAGIGEAADDTRAELDRMWRRGFPSDDESDRRSADDRSPEGDAAGTDQPPRMGGPLGPDRTDPHLPEGLQNADDRGSGAAGFDRGVDASRVGTLHQGVKEEDSRDAP
jgi:hypothetical protein